uniref:HNH endonuclease signature motif containing protein n=1 Tax=Nocardioides sp. TaxID=35761 RepID=UPI003516A70D
SILTHTEHDLTATETRRLACNAGILPVVLSGAGQILDAGRTRRLFTGIQRTLIKNKHKHCVAEGCDIPVAWTEIHHLTPWAASGHTNLTDGVPACSRHHHLFHDPRYHWRRQPDGRIRFHRRT